MSNVTPPASVSSTPPAPGSPLRGTLKGALATLVLLLLALLFWQLLDQLRETQKNQRQYTIDYTADLASQVSLNMALNAQIALNLLPIVEQPQSADEQQALLRKLQQSLPDLRSLALLSPSGRIISDSAADSHDADYLTELVRRSRAQAHYFSNADDGSVVHLLLHQASGSTRGYWALRLTPTFFDSLTKQSETGIRPLWLVENRINHQIISRDEALPSAKPGVLTPDDLANTVLTVPLSSSDWQLRGLFDRQRVLEELLPAFIGKCLLGLAFSLLPVIALLNMRRRQRQLHEGRRRYQDIFEGTGVALCVLDLSGLKQVFDKAQIQTSDQLKAWLDQPAQRQQLLQELRVTEVNQVALQLLNVNSCEHAWQLLIDGHPHRQCAIGNQVLDAVLQQQKQLELEIKLQDVNGRDQHLWMVLRLPNEQHDYKAVILSINDITSRKLIELSLLEREGFWSDVVRTVPDHLYVQDVISQRMIFSNHHLGQTLGYNRTELHQMGEYFWEILLHPEDADYYHRSRQMQRHAGYSQLLQCQLRFRHRDGKWRRFDIREQALARDKHDQVTRIIGVAKDITEQIEASESLRDSEQRYRMLAESISDVIFSTDSKLSLNYVSPSVQAVLGYDAEWIFQNGWQSTIANPQQLTGIYTPDGSGQQGAGQARATGAVAQPGADPIVPVRLPARRRPQDPDRVASGAGVGRTRRVRRRARCRSRHQPATPRRKRPAHGRHGVRALDLGDPDHRPGRLHRAGQRSLQPRQRLRRGAGARPVAEHADRRRAAGSPPALRAQATAPAQHLGRRSLAQAPQRRALPGVGRHHRGARRRRRSGQLRVLLQRHQRAQGQRAADSPPRLLRRPDPPAQPHAVPGSPAHRAAIGRAAEVVGGADVPRPRPFQTDQRLPRPRRRRPHAQGHGHAPARLRRR